MLVDDHALVRAAVRQALSAPGVEMVAEVGTAEEALDLAPRLRPDVLLVDIDLPGMDGVSLVRELAPRLPTTRIVMLTVSSADHHLLDAMRFGASGYLTKDLSPEALLRAVRSASDGELAMPRRMAARLVHRLVETSRRSDGHGRPGPRESERPRAGGASPARRGPHGSRDRRGAHRLAPDGRDARQQHPPQARRKEPGRGRRPVSRIRRVADERGRRRLGSAPGRGPRGGDLDAQQPGSGGRHRHAAPVRAARGGAAHPIARLPRSRPGRWTGGRGRSAGAGVWSRGDRRSRPSGPSSSGCGSRRSKRTDSRIATTSSPGSSIATIRGSTSSDAIGPVR